MDYKIVEKEAFTVVGVSRMFRYDTCQKEIPAFWCEHFESNLGGVICGMYGVCICGGADEFEYLIADDYTPDAEVPEGCVTRAIPAHTWAIFPCRGPMPDALQETNRKIFSEWLPNSREYATAAGYNIEMYSDADDYPNGVGDENYYTEIWIPVKKK